jgi:lactate dehydrogenase-like 2-hydroxyacid dehydrogenase
MSPSRVEAAAARKPRVVSLGEPKYAGREYLEAFGEQFDYEVLDAKNREETQAQLPALIKQGGPIDAFVIRMGTPPYEPFDEGLLRALVPDCKIITSASAGYNEFDVDWMSKEGILFCNSVDAVAEATADMAMFLILAVLRNTSNAEKSVRQGKWRGAPGTLSPARDPTNMTLGIIGMGAIGKVRTRHNPSLENL